MVVANPPYGGIKGLNQGLSAWLEANYSGSKSDLMTAFIQRADRLSLRDGYFGFITLPSWMFISAFEAFREHATQKYTFNSFLHLGRGIFGADFGSIAISVKNSPCLGGHRTTFRKLFDEHVLVRRPEIIESLFLDRSHGTFMPEVGNFTSIPGAPFAYWFSDKTIKSFSEGHLLRDVADVRTGMTTSDNNRFLRSWHEVSDKKFTRDARIPPAEGKWFPYNKGGGFRKWYGFCDNVINWEHDGAEIKSNVDEKGKRRASVRSESFYYRPCITYSSVTSGSFSARRSDAGFIFDSGGSCVFSDETNLNFIEAVFCSPVPSFFLSAFNETINFQPGDIGRIPLVDFSSDVRYQISNRGNSCVALARSDWDAYETSWDFDGLPLLLLDHRAETLEATYARLRAHWQGMTDEMKRMEEENNRIFIGAYGLQDELTPNVPIEEGDVPISVEIGRSSAAGLDVMLRRSAVQELV